MCPILRRAIAALAFGLASAAQGADCMSADRVDTLRSVRAAKWQMPISPAPDGIALDLLPCLADPDPAVRDQIAFEGLQAWMRGNQLQPATVHAIRTRLLGELAADDPRGFKRPFAALVLAEVARVDRVKPFLSADERGDLVARATAYLTSVRDYRGFDEQEGWRHGVAHAADWLLQLSLNPQLQRSQGEAMLAAVASQVVPAGGHVYRYGESERLMAPVFYLARKGWWNAGEWEQWLSALVARLPRDTMFKTQHGLAGRQNLGAFFSALYVAVRESGNAEVEAALLPGLKKGLRALD
jgi:hypothetical protein